MELARALTHPLSYSLDLSSNSRVTSQPDSISVQNYKWDLRVGFGDYVHVEVPLNKTNGVEAFTQGAIALLPTGKLQGSVKFFLLRSLRVVSRDQ